MTAIEAIYQGSVQKGRISSDEMKSRLSRIQPLRTYAGFDRADIIIEAVFEDIEVKRAVFAELGGSPKTLRFWPAIRRI
jgi:3-hydroxyacyl-CoA dehydrogenase